jgi:predicted transposase YbfD/YdcC
MKEEQLKLAAQHFAELPDPRIERSRQHPLVNIIVIALCAVVSDAESFYEIEEFGRTKQAWLAQFLNLENGIPSHDTFNRVFARLNPTHFQACFLDWVREAIGGSLSAGDVLAIDGKSLRGSGREEVQAVHMLNVWSHQHGLCLISTAVDGKTNEITMLPGLLDTLNLLDIAGCTITVDALHTQRETARKLLEYQAAYVLALKENQPKLHEDVVWLFEDALQFGVAGVDYGECVVRECGHGREETRQCVVLSELSYLQEHHWPGLKSIASVTCLRRVNGKSSCETRYYLCAFEADAQRVLHAVRAHWEVENKLHWMLDVVFGEDAHSYALDHGPENMAVLRQFALNLLRQDSSKGSLKGKRKRAAWNDDFRATLLAKLIHH